MGCEAHRVGRLERQQAVEDHDGDQRMRLRTVVIAPATLGVLESLMRSARGPRRVGRGVSGVGGQSAGAPRSVPLQAAKTRE